jgi:uncharacterized membrane protein
MQKYFLFTYALSSYLTAMASLTLLILWVYPWPFMPFQIDRGAGAPYALVLDLALIALFGIQHSVMARPAFKRRFFAGRSASFRASTYTLFSALCIFLILWLWQPLGGTLFAFESGPLYWGMTLLYFGGWGLAFVATFQIDHFELFGLHQGYRVLKGLPEPEARFQKKGFYRFMRHPVQTGTLIGLWATPEMSTGHLLFSLGMTGYILVGLILEERGLVKTLGEEYLLYRKETPMLFPIVKAK